tara:strand:- start:72 stop:1475 length:1404 start_codon:yes stop_codon:yes gene_type:complete
MATKQSSRSGNIRKFVLHQAKNADKDSVDTSIDISDIVSEIRYYEDVLSNSVSLTAVIAETGGSDDKKIGNVGILDGLPVRGGEPCDIFIEDHDGTPLNFKEGSKLYVNRVRNVISGTSKDVYVLDFAPRELFANEQSRVVKRYDGKISENIKQILSKDTSKGAGIKTEKDITVDETGLEYNFIGNDRKPFYVCTWLASKATPATVGKIGGSAGYLFYETYKGYNFRSIDALFDESKNEVKGKYLFSNTANDPIGYDGKILDYNIEKDIDLQNNLVIGAYANRTLFFDFYAMNYKVRNYSVDESGSAEENEGAGSKDKIVTAGKQGSFPGDTVADEFRKPVSRLMNRVIDIGTLPSGKDALDQLENWKDKPTKPTYDSSKIMVQSVMRYNQMFSIKINITIAANFDLCAGDLIRCEFPEISIEPNTDINKKSGGIYMISSLCHRLTTRDSYTKLTLVRDTFGIKSST